MCQKKPEAMTIRELKEQIRILSSQYVDTTKLETEMYQRVTIPFASFVLRKKATVTRLPSSNCSITSSSPFGSLICVADE